MSTVGLHCPVSTISPLVAQFCRASDSYAERDTVTAMSSWLSIRLSVCAYVCHAVALYWRNRSSTDHQAMIALRQPTGLTSKILVIFLRSHPTGARYRCGSLVRQVAQLSQRDLRRDGISQLNSCQLLHNCMKNYIWLEGSPFHVVQKYRQEVLWISHKARVWQTDRQTDGQTDRITTPKTALA